MVKFCVAYCVVAFRNILNVQFGRKFGIELVGDYGRVLLVDEVGVPVGDACLFVEMHEINAVAQEKHHFAACLLYRQVRVELYDVLAVLGFK